MSVVGELLQLAHDALDLIADLRLGQRIIGTEGHLCCEFRIGASREGSRRRGGDILLNDNYNVAYGCKSSVCFGLDQTFRAELCLCLLDLVQCNPSMLSCGIC